jgi:hypothetical protein
MEHDEAIRLEAAERYVAGELSPAERDAFEDHFFDCPHCAREVRMEGVFAANARAVACEQLRTRPADVESGWRAWFRIRPSLAFSLAANFALVAVCCLLLFRGPQDAGARFVVSYWAPPPAHGIETHVIPAGATALDLRFPVPSQKFSSYSYEILDASEKRESAGSVRPIGGEEGDLYLEVSLKGLPAGDHFLVVRGNPGSEVVSRSKFHI